MSLAPAREAATRLLGVALLCLCAQAAEPIPIGYYGPAEGAVWEGVQLAFEEANSGGEAFRVVQGWDENPWSGGAATVARMAYESNVAAVIGSVNGDATHLAEQVVAKALIPMMDPASTDRTVNAAFVPWVFSVMPDDRAFMRALADGLPSEPFILITSTRHDPRMMTTEFLKALGNRRPLRHIEFERPGDIESHIEEAGASVFVVLADAVDSARAVKRLRGARPDAAVYGSHSMGSKRFLREAGDAAARVRYVSSGLVDGGFGEKFRARFGQAPDHVAAHAYDAAKLILTAIQRGGRDREAITEALLALSPYEGVSGAITWDSLRRNTRPGGSIKLMAHPPSSPAKPAGRPGSPR